ncbi:MAG: acetate/propionate family kinase [Betaproteobacteria bacterium]
MNILTLNGGSSSIKFSMYRAGATLQRLLAGKVDRIGLGDATLSVDDARTGRQDRRPILASEFKSAATSLITWLEAQAGFDSIGAVGHRVVHGMRHSEPELVTPALLEELHRIEPYDPEHLPGEIQMMEILRQRHPKLSQVACFDTAFHHDMPRVARMLPIPRRFEASGVRRYGFHGLSYAYLMEELARVAGASVAQSRVILAHLGNGASLAAVKDGRSIDTSMGFTPTAGLPMGTRSGDIDPGLVSWLARSENTTAAQFDRMMSHESGLLGISETSSDMGDLLVRETTDVRAAEAVALFCYQAKKWVGAYAAALGGLDTLVFAGGVGENAVPVRARICEGMTFLGIELDPSRNAMHADVISTDASRVTVRIIRTDEELMIARSVSRLLGHGQTNKGQP